MHKFDIGSRVRLSNLTYDDQIDHYLNQPLQVVRQMEDVVFDGTHIKPHWSYLPQYELVAPDGIVIICNEYELEPA